jgi:hypothetical protein
MTSITKRAAAAGMTSTHLALLITLMLLVLLGMLCIGALLFLRSMRRSQKQLQDIETPPAYSRLTITATPYKRTSVTVYSEKQGLMDSPPPSPVPEIRITFPDEVDEAGKQQGGRVVIVRVGEHSVGLEPVNEELPAYQRDAEDRFDSLDLDRMGGLKEKDEKYYS